MSKFYIQLFIVIIFTHVAMVEYHPGVCWMSKTTKDIQYLSSWSLKMVVKPVLFNVQPRQLINYNFFESILCWKKCILYFVLHFNKFKKWYILASPLEIQCVEFITMNNKWVEFIILNQIPQIPYEIQLQNYLVLITYS